MSAVFPNIFLPRPGRFGVVPTLLTSGRINTGTLAAGTQTHSIGTAPARSLVLRATVSAETFPTAATSCTIRLVKRDVSAAANVNLSDAIDINTKTAEQAIAIPLLATLTDADARLDAGDTLKLSLVTTGAVSVQPEDLVVVVELTPLR
jgi:hypothetical protein